MRLIGFHSPAWLAALPMVFAQVPTASMSQVQELSLFKVGIYEPNFAKKMLSPIEDVEEKPRLNPSRMVDTISVAIIDDGVYCNPQRCDIAKCACEAWILATKSIPEGGLHFTYRVTTKPLGADIVFVFGTPDQFRGYEGYTSEYGTHALVRLSVVDRKGETVDAEHMRRIATHEVGHALGIWGHSPNPTDIMSLSLEAKTISIADVNTLRLAYKK